MTFRNHTTTLFALATISACAMAPAHADIPHPDVAVVGAITEQLPPGDLLGNRPASVATDWPMDPPMPVPTAGPPLLASWRGADLAHNPPGLIGPGLGSAAGGGGRPDTDGDGRGGSCKRTNNRPPFCPRPPDPLRPEPAVPGPAGLLGVGAMFRASRQLRRRIK